MLKQFLQRNINGNTIEDIARSIRQGVPSAVFGVNEPFKNYLVSTIKKPVLYIVKDGLEASLAEQAIKEFSSKSVAVLPAKDELLLSRLAFSKDAIYKRISAIKNLKNTDVLIVTAESVSQLLPKNIDFISLKVGEEIEQEYLIKTLVSLGYARVEKTESKGTFSVRGDIIDVFPVTIEDPVRIEFFGDTVENIKTYSVEETGKKEFINNVEITASIETIFSPEELNKIKEQIREDYKSVSKKGRARFSEISDDFLFAIEKNDYDLLSPFAPLSCSMGYITDILPKETVVVFSESKRIYEMMENLEREFTERHKFLLEEGETVSVAINQTQKIQDFITAIKSFSLVALQSMTTLIPFFNPLYTKNLSCSGISNYQLSFKEIFSDIKNWLFTGYKVLVCTGSLDRCDKFSYELSANDIPYLINGIIDNSVTITSAPLDNGFVYHEDKVVVIGSGNAFARQKAKKKYKIKNNAFFSAPDAGDYCVHEIHGVGKVLGGKKITTTDGTKDYVAVEYYGGDVLYVPVEQIDVLTRYLGGDKNPKLSRIGGRDFERVKERVKESIKKMSFDLKKLYEERNALNGFKFSDDDFQPLFESAFRHEDTLDQITATEDIKNDMLSAKVMDRLVCGDVGFGKTEVAFRAVFRAIENGKQVAMLAPTTILTEQHFNTAVDRFKDFGVRIECLNRFRTPKQQKSILERLENGKVDFVIGTHRLLGADVKFKDLGLLVLDEEQRFGVEHKEKIKLLKKNVDTLTLTATPIPRTLHMSLSGIRSISTINTPPKTRLPVQTYVTEETDGLLKDAILKELNRGGQVFLLYNRVESINNFAEKIRALIPNLKITVAHGQMEERRLEKSIMEFYRGETNVLISTTIIENGIDLPKANTIIVIDADKLGLSTLYQLKGRVGRGDRLAYAYFTFKRDKVLTDTAYHRLNAITEFAEMGSGIKIAMRDLEIRGAGNVLGAEQHGHMDKIGYELYSKLLKEELTGEEERIVELDIRITAYISERYIENRSARMDVYKEIAELSNEKEELELKEKLKDVYGKLPEETLNLFIIASVKRFATKYKATAVNVCKEKTNVEFDSVKDLFNPDLSKAVEDSFGEVVFSVSGKPSLSFIRGNKSNIEVLIAMKEFFNRAVKG